MIAGQRCRVDVQPTPNAAFGAEAILSVAQQNAPLFAVLFGLQRAFIFQLCEDLGDHLAVYALPVGVIYGVHTEAPRKNSSR
ncbi:hypothetical protein D3C76_1326270 [compost metagenome]